MSLKEDPADSDDWETSSYSSSSSFMSSSTTDENGNIVTTFNGDDASSEGYADPNGSYSASNDYAFDPNGYDYTANESPYQDPMEYEYEQADPWADEGQEQAAIDYTLDALEGVE